MAAQTPVPNFLIPLRTYKLIRVSLLCAVPDPPSRESCLLSSYEAQLQRSDGRTGKEMKKTQKLLAEFNFSHIFRSPDIDAVCRLTHGKYGGKRDDDDISDISVSALCSNVSGFDSGYPVFVAFLSRYRKMPTQFHVRIVQNPFDSFSLP